MTSQGNEGNPCGQQLRLSTTSFMQTLTVRINERYNWLLWLFAKNAAGERNSCCISDSLITAKQIKSPGLACFACSSSSKSTSQITLKITWVFDLRFCFNFNSPRHKKENKPSYGCSGCSSPLSHCLSPPQYFLTWKIKTNMNNALLGWWNVYESIFFDSSLIKSI